MKLEIIIIFTLLLILSISPFRVCANEISINDFENTSNWDVVNGNISISTFLDDKNNYIVFHFNGDQSNYHSEIEFHNKFDFSSYDGISFDYYTPIVNEKILLDIRITESGGATYDSYYIPLENPGWNQVSLHFVALDDMYADSNRKLDGDKIEKISINILPSEGFVIPRDYEIFLNNFKGIKPVIINQTVPENLYQLISNIEVDSARVGAIDNDGNYFLGHKPLFFDRYGNLIFEITKYDQINNVDIFDNELIVNPPNKIASYGKNGTFNWEYTLYDYNDVSHGVVNSDWSLNDGECILANYKTINLGNKYEIEIISVENNRLIKKFIMDDYGKVHISPNGEYVLVVTWNYSDSLNSHEKVFLFDKKGTLIWEKEKIIRHVMMKNDEIKSLVHNSIETRDLNLNLISKKSVFYANGEYFYVDSLSKPYDNIYAIGFSSSSDISAVAIDDVILFLDNKKIINRIKINGDGTVNTLYVSPNGKYILGITDGGGIYVFSNEGLVSPLFPKDDDVIEVNRLKFEWIDTEAVKYLLKIDNKTYEINETSFVLSESFESGYHDWTVKPIFENKEGNWFKPIRFFSMDVENVVVTENEIIKKDVDIKIVITGVLILVISSTILLRPYYKRYSLKQNLSKTPTDWCPHCHKFTGGNKICPHCGIKFDDGNLIFIYENEKSRKKG